MNSKERIDLLKSKEFWMVQIQNDLYGLINKFKQKNNLNGNGLADKFKVTKGYISQIMNGNFDHKLSKLVDLSLKSDHVPVISFLPIETILSDDEQHDDPLFSMKNNSVNHVTNSSVFDYLQGEELEDYFMKVAHFNPQHSPSATIKSTLSNSDYVEGVAEAV